MIVKCPKCTARFKVPDDRMKPEGIKVRCGRCKTVFKVRAKRAAPKVEPNEERTVVAPSPTETPLGFSFPGISTATKGTKLPGPPPESFTTRSKTLPRGSGTADTGGPVFGGAANLPSLTPSSSEPPEGATRVVHDPLSELYGDDQVTGQQFPFPQADEGNDQVPSRLGRPGSEEDWDLDDSLAPMFGGGGTKESKFSAPAPPAEPEPDEEPAFPVAADESGDDKISRLLDDATGSPPDAAPGIDLSELAEASLPQPQAATAAPSLTGDLPPIDDVDPLGDTIIDETIAPKPPAAEPSQLEAPADDDTGLGPVPPSLGAGGDTAARWLASLLTLVLLAGGFLAYVTIKNGGVLDFNNVSQTFGVAFRGWELPPDQSPQVIRVYELGGELVEQPVESAGFPLEFRDVSQAAYETGALIEILVVEGNLLNAGDTSHRRIFIEGTLRRGSEVLATIVAPVGGQLSQEDLERVYSSDSLAEVYDRLRTQVRSLVLAENTMSSFTVAFPNVSHEEVEALEVDLKVIRAERVDSEGRWRTYAFDPAYAHLL